MSSLLNQRIARAGKPINLPDYIRLQKYSVTGLLPIPKLRIFLPILLIFPISQRRGNLGQLLHHLLLAGRLISVNTRTGHASAFASHHFDELAGHFAGLGVSAEQSDILLVQVRYLNRVHLFLIQTDLHRIDHSAATSSKVSA